MLTMAILHLTVSQSVFVVIGRGYRSDGRTDVAATFSANGFSVIPIITCELLQHLKYHRSGLIDSSIALLIGFILLIGIILLSLRRYPVGMPMVSTCSAAISAAYHQPTPEDKDAYLLPVKWGVVEHDEKGIGHCSFSTARDLEPPEQGNRYA
jgi:hypothetical protein